MKPRAADAIRTVEADILILGSGAAGCGAALGASRQGARAVLVDKGKLESSGCLGGGNDHFMAILNRGQYCLCATREYQNHLRFIGSDLAVG